MIRFVKFIKGLRKQAEELKERFDSVREQIVDRMLKEDGRASLRWTLPSQLDEYDLWPEADDDDDDEVARYEDVMKRVHEEERARYERFMRRANEEDSDSELENQHDEDEDENEGEGEDEDEGSDNVSS